MNFLLHRDTYTALLRGNPRVGSHCSTHLGRLYISALAVTLVEMWLGRARTPSRFLFGYNVVRRQIQVLPVDEMMAHRAALIGNSRRRVRPQMTIVDSIAAATALEQKLTLVTHDLAHFVNIPGLNVIDWTVP